MVGDGSEESTCIYQGPDNWALMTIQVSSADFYDVVSIQQSHTAVNIGDKGRSNVDEAGNAAVQFVKGDSSVMISIRVFSQRDNGYAAALIRVATEAAEKMP